MHQWHGLYPRFGWYRACWKGKCIQTSRNWLSLWLTESISQVLRCLTVFVCASLEFVILFLRHQIDFQMFGYTSQENALVSLCHTVHGLDSAVKIVEHFHFPPALAAHDTSIWFTLQNWMREIIVHYHTKQVVWNENARRRATHSKTKLEIFVQNRSDIRLDAFVTFDG